jgi:hypothetical protein
MINCSDIPIEKLVEYVNQLYGISEAQPIPLEELPIYIKQKLEEKQNIDEELILSYKENCIEFLFFGTVSI